MPLLPPLWALGNSIRGEVVEGQAFLPRNIPFQLLRPVGIPAKDKGPREPQLAPRAPIPSRAGASGALLRYLLSTMALLEADVEGFGWGWVAVGGR